MLVAIVLAVLLSGCGGAGSGGAVEPDRGLDIVATTSILGDLTSRVVGADADVEVLIPIGVDPHDFEASARQAEALRTADVVIANGLGLEAGLESTLESAEADGAHVVRVAPQVDPLPFGARGDDGESDAPPTGGELDPHVWLDPSRMAEAAVIIGNAIVAAGEDEGATQDASGRAGGTGETAEADDVGERAQEVATSLRALTDELREALDAIPQERRTLVTNHDALGYFAERFGFRIVGTVIPSGSSLAEPSSRELADLAAEIAQANIPAVFAETTLPTRLSEALAAEVGREVEVVELYTGSLGESEASTYEEMMRLNVDRMVGALS